MINIQTQCQKCGEDIFMRTMHELEFDLQEENEMEQEDYFSTFCPKCNAEIEYTIILHQIQKYNYEED